MPKVRVPDPVLSVSEKIEQALLFALDLVVEFLNRADLKGGAYYLILPQPGANRIVQKGVVGKIVKRGRLPTYRRQAREMAKRLDSRNLRTDRALEVSSWQSRNSAKRRYQGGIRASPGRYVAFSGLTEEANEALCLLFAGQMGWMTLRLAVLIGTLSGNEIFSKLSRQVRWPAGRT